MTIHTVLNEILFEEEIISDELLGDGPSQLDLSLFSKLATNDRVLTNFLWEGNKH